MPQEQVNSQHQNNLVTTQKQAYIVHNKCYYNRISTSTAKHRQSVSDVDKSWVASKLIGEDALSDVVIDQEKRVEAKLILSLPICVALMN